MTATRRPSADAPAPSPAAPDPVARAKAALDAARARSQARADDRARERQRDDADVQRAQAGDQGAFRRLVEAHQARMFAVAIGIVKDRDDAMDVVQDTFIKAHRKLGEFEGNAAFSTWLHRICVNLCIDKKRADARRKITDLDDESGRLLDEKMSTEGAHAGGQLGHNPLKNAADKELGGALSQALDRLSEEHRTILVLREVDGLSYEEIAETLGIPRGTVMSRLFHARKNMQRLLGPYLAAQKGSDLGDATADEEKAGARRPSSNTPPAAPALKDGR